MAALFPDKVLELLLAGIDSLKGGVSASERERRKQKLEAELLEHERIEEAFVVQALAAGLEVHRRPYASGWAILGIEQDEVIETVIDNESMQAAG